MRKCSLFYSAKTSHFFAKKMIKAEFRGKGVKFRTFRDQTKWVKMRNFSVYVASLKWLSNLMATCAPLNVVLR